MKEKRFYFISLSIAMLALLPTTAQYFDFTLPLASVLRIPATGLDYMAVFFHEIGHTIWWLVFGYKAVPAFDFAHGGGVTLHDFDRSWVLQFIAAVLLLAGLGWLWLHRAWFYFLLLAGTSAFILMTAFTPMHEIIPVYMGHGTEVLIACFCLLRGMANIVEGDNKILERYLNMIFGLYVLGRNAFLSLGLVMSDIARSAYAMQKSGHIRGDFQKLAEFFGVNIQTIGSSVFILMCIAVIGTLLFVHWAGRSETVR